VRRRWKAFLSLISVPGLVVFLAIAAPWFVAMQAHFAGFLDYFFVVQHFKRFAAGGFNNVQPFWFYPAVLLLFTLPWLPWFRPQLEHGRLSDPVRGPVRLLLWVWLLVVVGFFSLPASKLLGYVLPAVPPLAVLLADGLQTWRERWPRSGQRWRLSAGFTVALNIGVIGLLAVQAPKSTKDIGATLRAQRSGGEPVFMLDNYYFDLPLYARLPDPVATVLDWSDPEIHRRDTWRKELADAGEFAPSRAKSALIEPAGLRLSLCAQPVSWVVGPPGAAQTYPFLATAKVSSRGRNATLWRVDRAQAQINDALACPGTPNAG